VIIQTPGDDDDDDVV